MGERGKAGKHANRPVVENIKKLEERLIVHLDEKIFIYTSFAVGANTIVKTQDGKTVAEGKREKPLLGPYVMDIKEEYEPVKILLFMGFVVFNYYHRQ